MNFKEEIKAIAFDFDGTLIDFNYEATEYTFKALELLKNSKYKVCLSSGRPCFLALKAFEDKFGKYPLDYIFGCNGNEMMNCKTNETEILFPLKAEDVRKLGKELDVDYLMLGIYEGDKFLVNHYRNTKSTNDWLKARWLTPIEYDFSKNDVDRSKVIIINDFDDREKEDEFLSKIDLSKYSYAYSSPQCFEIVPKGVNKAKAISRLCEILNCDNSQILTFGDMQNDLPMLLNSTGVAMDNASEEIKKQVKLKTSAVDKLGVYEFLHNNELI